MNKLITITLLLLFAFNANAQTTYYVSKAGSDANNGTSTSTPWQTIAKVNSHTFSSGDIVLFKKGDTFVGNITTNSDGVTYDSYGSGNLPIITGLVSVTSWTNLGSNIWESTSSVSTLPALNIVLINGINTKAGQYPNDFGVYQSHSGNNSITSSILNSSDTDWTGADVFIRINDFYQVKRTIASHSGGTLTYSGSDYEPEDGNGYFITDDPRTLDQQNEWYYNPSTGKIRIYSTSSPTGVQVPTQNSLFYCKNESITLQNISFIGAADTAVAFYASPYSTIQNVSVKYVGLTGIHLDYTVDGTIANNTVSNCNDVGISAGGADVTISGNTIDSIGVLWNENGCGIILNSDLHTVTGNIITNLGRYGIQDAYGYGTTQNNYIDKYCLKANDAGGFYTNGSRTGERIIDHNIIINGVGNLDGNGASSGLGIEGIYLDAQCKSATVTNNTIYNAPQSGIKMHMANSCRIENNTVYNCGREISMEDYEGNYIRLDTVRYNMFFAKNNVELALYWYTVNNDITSAGIFANNIYSNPLNTSQLIQTREPSTGYTYRNLSNWQSYFEPTASSLTTWTDTTKLLLAYNPTLSTVNQSLSGTYEDATGTAYSGTISLGAFQGILLYNTGGVAAPTISVSGDQVITVSNTSVSASATWAAGHSGSYLWTQTAGTTATITSPTNAATAITGLVGHNTFKCTATQDDSQTANGSVNVYVDYATANAGGNQTITLPTSSVTLNGSGTSSDGTVSSYWWTQVSGPNSASFGSPALATTTMTGLIQGTYVVNILVTDSYGATANNTATITVNPGIPIIIPGTKITMYGKIILINK